MSFKDENIERDLIKEERTIWQEPYGWNYKRHGMYVPEKPNSYDKLRKFLKRVLNEEDKEA